MKSDKAKLTETEAAAQFKALGDPTRLRIFTFLHGCCAGEITVDNRTGAARRVDGVTVGEVCCFVTGEDRITSTLSHHLRELRLAGLVDVERRGKNMICRLNQNAAAFLADFLADAGAARTDCGSRP